MLLPILIALAAQGAGVDAAASPPVAGRVAMFPRSEVRLLEGPFLAAQGRDVGYLLRLDPDRLLHTFRLNAGLPSHARPLGGWEAPGVELRGHTMGHYLSACALMFEATGDQPLADRAVGIVAELDKVQKALAARGANPGYLSAFPESFFDRLEARTGVWAPYYTIHKILAGLLDVNRATGDATALELAKGIARWVGLRASRLSPAQWQELLETEFGGMEDALDELYRRTRDKEDLRLARLFDHKAVFDPLARGEDRLDGLHANTQIPKAIGAAFDCSLTGDRRYCAVAETFWERVARHRSYVIGGNSEDEFFSPLAHFSRHLGERTAETCNMYNMLKLTRRLFELDGDPARIDFYERGLYNQILASQDPVSGMVTYHVALASGSWRTFSTPEDSFWCCVGTGLENPARYGETIYSRQGDAVLVNLFIPSELRWRENGLVLRQETRFPDEDRVRLTLQLEQPARFALRVRHPAWAKGPLAAAVDGEPAALSSQPGSFATIERVWKDGDVVELRLPMALHAEAMPDDPSVVAFLYGPIVLAADLGSVAPDAKRYGPQAPEVALEDAPPPPVLIADGVAQALARLRPDAGALTFRSVGLARPAEIELRPFFRLADRRYAVYFHVMDEKGWAERRARAEAEAQAERQLDARTVDRVQPGVAADENAHALQEKGSQSERYEGRLSRSVFWGSGEFSYSLRLPAAGPAALRFTCWGGESHPRKFLVLVDGEAVTTQSLFDDRPGELLPVEVPIPERLTKGRDHVRVGFRPAPQGSVGAVFDVRIVTPAAAAPGD